MSFCLGFSPPKNKANVKKLNYRNLKNARDTKFIVFLICSQNQILKTTYWDKFLGYIWKLLGGLPKELEGDNTSLTPRHTAPLTSNRLSSFHNTSNDRGHHLATLVSPPWGFWEAQTMWLEWWQLCLVTDSNPAIYGSRRQVGWEVTGSTLYWLHWNPSRWLLSSPHFGARSPCCRDTLCSMHLGFRLDTAICALKGSQVPSLNGDCLQKRPDCVSSLRAS